MLIGERLTTAFSDWPDNEMGVDLNGTIFPAAQVASSVANAACVAAHY